MKRSIAIIGFFGYNNNQIDGQTIKTREIYHLIKKNSNGKKIYFVDTQSLKYRRLKTLFSLIYVSVRSRTIVYLPGKNNLRKFFPILFYISKLFHNDIIYPVVGGWLADFINDKESIQIKLKKIKAILVESKRLKKDLIIKYGFDNVSLLTNFRSKKYIPFTNRPNKQLRVVFMARITKAKGCDSLFEIADLIDKDKKNIQITFFGQIDSCYEIAFKSKIVSHQRICRYGGVINPEDVYSVLNNYDVLALPTFYEGEGFPGSVVDAYKAGIPVIVSDWKDLPEYVKEGETGYIVKLNTEDLYRAIMELYNNSDKLDKMKNNAYKESQLYNEESGWKVISKLINRT